MSKKSRMKSRRTELAIEEARIEAEGSPMQQENSEFVPKGRLWIIPGKLCMFCIANYYSHFTFMHTHTHTHTREDGWITQ